MSVVLGGFSHFSYSMCVRVQVYGCGMVLWYGIIIRRYYSVMVVDENSALILWLCTRGRFCRPS